MITYELAKKLKDAGFPQNINTCGFVYREDERGDLIDLWPVSKQCFNGQPDRYVLCPTLEELIEACGKDFERLECWSYDAEPQWRAYSEKIITIHDIDGKKIPCESDCCGFMAGETPDEAMANLYIKQNE